MNTQYQVYIISSALLIVFALQNLAPSTHSQEDEDDDEDLAPTGQVISSKYLAISGVTFNENDNQVSISGTISNNSTDQSFANVLGIGQLYDDENRLITAFSGIANLTNLGPGQQSPFTITSNIPSDEEVSHYIVMPGGSAIQ
jgi:hypothetical protein